MRLDTKLHYLENVLYAPFVSWEESSYSYSGNNLNIGNLSNNTVRRVVDVNKDFRYEQNVNESSTLFKNNGDYFLFYSTGYWNRHYSIRYLKSATVNGLFRNGSVRSITFPEYSSSTHRVKRNRGAPTIVNILNKPIMFYQKMDITVPTDGKNLEGDFLKSGKRSTYWTRLKFDNNNNPIPRLDWLQNASPKGRLRRADNWGDNDYLKCLDNPDDSKDLGKQYQQLLCNNTLGQKFDLIDMTYMAGPDTTKPYVIELQNANMLRNKASGMCLGVKDASFYHGQKVVQDNCTGAKEQRWVLDYSGNFFRIQSKIKPEYCLTFPFNQQHAAIASCYYAPWWYWN